MENHCGDAETRKLLTVTERGGAGTASSPVPESIVGRVPRPGAPPQFKSKKREEPRRQRGRSPLTRPKGLKANPSVIRSPPGPRPVLRAQQARESGKDVWNGIPSPRDRVPDQSFSILNPRASLPFTPRPQFRAPLSELRVLPSRTVTGPWEHQATETRSTSCWSPSSILNLLSSLPLAPHPLPPQTRNTVTIADPQPLNP